MGALLSRLIATQPRWQPGAGAAGAVPMDYLGRLARAFRPDTTGRQPATPPSSTIATGLVMMLSHRERQVLQLLAAGKQNQEIADELYITRDTVKKHITHIFDKLGVANRTQATIRPGPRPPQLICINANSRRPRMPQAACRERGAAWRHRVIGSAWPRTSLLARVDPGACSR